MGAKTIVKTFYDLDLAVSKNAMQLFHQDCELHWNSSKGFTVLNYEGIDKMLKNVQESFHSFTYKLSHLLESDNTVTARYTIYVTSIEKPEEEEALAHFISIWEVKDEKLYRGWEMSQMLDETLENISSYSEIKI